jgi:hypothetical protein
VVLSVARSNCDDQAKLLREQISRAEQAEVTVRMHQV